MSSKVTMSAKLWKAAMSSGRLWNLAKRAFTWKPPSGLTSTESTISPNVDAHAENAETPSSSSCLGAR